MSLKYWNRPLAKQLEVVIDPWRNGGNRCLTPGRDTHEMEVVDGIEPWRVLETLLVTPHIDKQQTHTDCKRTLFRSKKGNMSSFISTQQ